MTTQTSLITVHNAFHGSTTTIVCHGGRLTARQVRNAERRLCGSSTCLCLDDMRRALALVSTWSPTSTA